MMALPPSIARHLTGGVILLTVLALSAPVRGASPSKADPPPASAAPVGTPPPPPAIPHSTVAAAVQVPSPVPRVAATPAVESISEMTPAASKDEGGPDWLTLGLAALLALSVLLNLLAGAWIWVFARKHGGFKNILPWNHWPSRAESAENPGSLEAYLGQFGDLLEEMKSALDQRRAEQAPGGRMQGGNVHAINPRSSIAPPRASTLSPTGGTTDLQRIIDKLDQIEKVISHPVPAEPIRLTPPSSYPTEPSLSEPTVTFTPDPFDAVDRETKRLVKEYNAAAQNKRSGEEFMSRSRAFRFGVQNSNERFRNTQIEAIFGQYESGDCIAVQMTEESYAIFPRFQVPLTNERYRTGAIGTMFDCPNYQPQYVYPQVTVVKPAIFEKVGAGGWQLRTLGQLDLGREQPA